MFASSLWPLDQTWFWVVMLVCWGLAAAAKSVAKAAGGPVARSLLAELFK